MRNIYILLTRSKSMTSRIIHMMTGDEYTHSSIAYDDELKTLSSFARRRVRFPLPSGLVHEQLQGGYFALHQNIPCALLRLSVEDEVYDAVKARVEKMLRSQQDYSYDIKGLIFCKLRIQTTSEKKYFCSRYVAETLQSCGALSLPKAPSLMRPQDYMGIKQLKCVYRGTVGGLAGQTA